MNLVRSTLLVTLLLTGATTVFASAAEELNLEKLRAGPQRPYL